MVFAFIFPTEDIRGVSGKGQASHHVLSLQLMKLKQDWKKSAFKGQPRLHRQLRLGAFQKLSQWPARDFTGPDAKWGFTQRCLEASPTELGSAQAGTAHCLPACRPGFFSGWPRPAPGIPPRPRPPNTPAQDRRGRARHQLPWAGTRVSFVPCPTVQGACGRFQVVLSLEKGPSSAYRSPHHHALHGDCTGCREASAWVSLPHFILIRTPPRPAPPMPRPFCCFCCCGPPRPRPLAASSRTMSMISSGMRRYLMVLPRM